MSTGGGTAVAEAATADTRGYKPAQTNADK